MSLKASEVIIKLVKLIEKYGDHEVISGGEDYPGPVTDVDIVVDGNGYEPKGSFRIHGGI